MTTNSYADIVMQRCDALASFSEEPGRLTRRFATDAPFEAEPLRVRLDVRRTQPLDCGQFRGDAATGPSDLGHNSAAR